MQSFPSAAGLCGAVLAPSLSFEGTVGEIPDARSVLSTWVRPEFVCGTDVRSICNVPSAVFRRTHPDRKQCRPGTRSDGRGIERGVDISTPRADRRGQLSTPPRAMVDRESACLVVSVSIDWLRGRLDQGFRGRGGEGGGVGVTVAETPLTPSAFVSIRPRSSPRVAGRPVREHGAAQERVEGSQRCRSSRVLRGSAPGGGTPRHGGTGGFGSNRPDWRVRRPLRNRLYRFRFTGYTWLSEQVARQRRPLAGTGHADKAARPPRGGRTPDPVAR